MALTNETAMMAETTVEDDKKPKKKTKIRQKKSTATAEPAAPAASAAPAAMGAIGQAAQQKQDKEIPTVSKYFIDSYPNLEESLKRVGFNALNNMGRDRSGPIQFASGMGSGETDWLGNPKTSKGGGLSERYSKSINYLMQQLEKSNVNNIDQARTTLAYWFKPENRKDNIGAESIFNESAWKDNTGKQKINGSTTYEQDLINKVSQTFMDMKKERDEKYGVKPGQTAAATKELKTVPSVSVTRQ